MKKYRILSLILALLTLSSVAACGGSAPGTQDSTTPSANSDDTETTPDTTAELKPDLPDKKFDGYEFNIVNTVAGWSIYNNEHIVVEEENGEVLNDAIFNRNRHVEDKYGVKLVETVVSDTSSEITKTVMAGDDEYDLAVSTYSLKLGTEYLVDWNTLSYTDLSKPWWDQNYIEATSVDGKLCSMVGSIMITHMDSVLAMFYNQKLAGEYKLPDLYEIVRNGEWTLPKYFEITKDVTSDTNGDGTFDDLDRYAFVGLDGILRLASGVELDYVKKDKDDIPQTNFGDQRLVNTLTKLREYNSIHKADIYNARSANGSPNTGGDGDRVVFRLFLNDQAMFYVHGLGSAQMFRDMKSDFGVIPTPKLDETQEDYFIQPDITKCMAIPTTASDLERTSIILEALAYEGYSYLRPLYYKTMLQNKYLRDEESVEMLDEYIYTNIGFAPNNGSSTLTAMKNSLLTGDSEIASTLASNKAAIDGEIADYVALFK